MIYHYLEVLLVCGSITNNNSDIVSYVTRMLRNGIMADLLNNFVTNKNLTKFCI